MNAAKGARMIIIDKKKRKKIDRKAWSGVGFRKVDVSDQAEHVDAQGFESEEDVEDEKGLPHPFRRKERFEAEMPGIIRWLWNPRTGEIISSAGRATEHAIMLLNYKNRAKKGKKKKDVGPYDEWIRGFYFPRTHELAIRSYDLEAFRPASSFAIRTPEDEALYFQMAKEESRRIQESIKRILEVQIGKFKRVHYDVDEQYLRDRFQGVGGERW